MTKKIVWLVVSCLMVAALVMTSCGPAVTEEEEPVSNIVFTRPLFFFSPSPLKERGIKVEDSSRGEVRVLYQYQAQVI